MMSAIFSIVPQLLTSIAGLLAAFYVWALWTFRRQIREAEKLPCLFPRYPFFGHVFQTLGPLHKVGKLAEGMWQEGTDKGYEIICFWIGPIPLFLLLRADAIGKVLNSSKALSKSVEQETFVAEFMGNGLITAPADHWKVTRRHMNPLFNSQNLNFMMSSINRNCRHLVTCLANDSKKGPVELSEHIMNTTLKTACYLTVGQDIDINSQDFQALKRVNEWIPDLLLNRILKIWLRFDSLYKFLLGRKIKEMKGAWVQFAESRVKVAKERYRLSKTINGIEGQDGNNCDKSLLTVVDAYRLMQESIPSITDKDLDAELITITAAGSDTLATAVSSCFLALAQFPQIQEKLYQEIISVVEPDNDVTMQDLLKLPYLDQVLKESMRLLSPVPFISRRSTEDVTLNSCTIPAGTAMYLCLAALHMDPRVYPDPLAFKPERFAGENGSNVDNFTYLPFGGGPRTCIGKTYAYTVMKCMVIQILLRYRVTTNMDIYKLRKKLSAVMTSVDGYKVSLHERT